METDHGMIAGPLTVDREIAVHGMVTGQVTVVTGATLYLHGMVIGDLVVETGAEAFVHGMVNGTVHNRGGMVQIEGVVGSVLSEPEGFTAIAPAAVVRSGLP